MAALKRRAILLLCIAAIFCTARAESALKVITRAEWQAEDITANLTKLQLPIHRVVIIHTATSDCTNEGACAQILRNVQYHQMQRGLDDIAYNFLIGDDGNIYEGRGWDQQGAFARSWNTDSLGIAFIGSFAKLTPDAKALAAAKELIAEGVNTDKIASNYKLLGHRQLVPTESPGAALYTWVKQQPHWSHSNS